MSAWLNMLKAAKKSCIVDGKFKKVRYELGDGQELVEEYNTDTDILSRRAWKRKSKFGGDGDWEIEIGEPEPMFNNKDAFVIRESASEPFVTRRVTKFTLEWRIRNLPYPLQVYSVTADPDNKSLVVRTSNKKYFKRLPVPDLERLNIYPEQDRISLAHKFNTLIITYQKPKELLEFENAVSQEVRKLRPANPSEMGCKPS